MTYSTIDLACPCGATMHYVGPNVVANRDVFLAAHEACIAAARPTPLALVRSDPASQS